MKNEVICPVYFDGKALRKDRNINSVFTSGFDVFRIMNKVNAKVAEGYFKKDGESAHKDCGKRYIINNQRYTIRNCAETYAKANIFDLVIQTMNAFRTEILTTYPGCFAFYFGVEETDKLRDILNNKIGYLSTDSYSNTEAFLQGNINGISIYNEIYFNIFESVIVNSMNHFLGNNARIVNSNMKGINDTDNTESFLDYVYRKMYKDCYGDDSDIDLSISFELKYNFISSILREIMSKYLANLAIGINAILYNSELILSYSKTDPMNKALGIKTDDADQHIVLKEVEDLRDWRKIEL